MLAWHAEDPGFDPQHCKKTKKRLKLYINTGFTSIV
jgi:hypothetical protein